MGHSHCLAILFFVVCFVFKADDVLEQLYKGLPHNSRLLKVVNDISAQ